MTYFPDYICICFVCLAGLSRHLFVCLFLFCLYNPLLFFSGLHMHLFCLFGWISQTFVCLVLICLDLANIFLFVFVFSGLSRSFFLDYTDSCFALLLFCLFGLYMIFFYLVLICLDYTGLFLDCICICFVLSVLCSLFLLHVHLFCFVLLCLAWLSRHLFVCFCLLFFWITHAFVLF